MKNIVWNTVWEVTFRDWEDIDESERFDDFIAKCELGGAVMPAAKLKTCDEDPECDDSDDSEGVAYYDDMPSEDTHVA